MKKKIYAFNNGGSREWYQAIAVGEDGMFLASHTCSHEGFMPHDMGVTSDWKHEVYNAWAPDGWEIEFIPFDSFDTHEKLKEVIALHEELGKPCFEKASKTSVTIELSKD